MRTESGWVLQAAAALAVALCAWFITPDALGSTPDQALSAVLSDPRVRLHDQAISTVQSASVVNPISEAELRIDKGSFDKDEIKYGLRLHTKGLSEYSRAKPYTRLIEESEKLLRQERLASLLSERYILISKAAQLKKKRELISDLRQTIDRTSRAMEFAARRNRGELKNTIGSKADIEKLQSLQSQIEREYANLDRELNGLGLGSLKDFEVDALAGPDIIGKRLKEGSAFKEVPLQARLASLQRSRAESALSFDQAKNSKWLSYVQLSYAEDRREKTYGIEFGILLPFLSSANPDLLDKTTKSLRDQADALSAEREALESAQSTSQELESAITLFETLSKGQGSMDREKVKKLSESVSRQDPFLALELEKSWIEGRIALLDLEARIRELFISHLKSQSVLSRDPGVNHLSKTLSRVN